MTYLNDKTNTIAKHLLFLASCDSPFSLKPQNLSHSLAQDGI